MMQQAAFQKLEEALNTIKLLKFRFILAIGKELLKNKIILILFPSLGGQIIIFCRILHLDIMLKLIFINIK
jgi:hypothetical protein